MEPMGTSRISRLELPRANFMLALIDLFSIFFQSPMILEVWFVVVGQKHGAHACMVQNKPSQAP